MDEAEATNLSVPDAGSPAPAPIPGARPLVWDATIGGDAYVNADINWPKYALLLQSIELALKAYCYQCVDDGQPKPKGLHNHDLKGSTRPRLASASRPYRNSPTRSMS